MATYIHEQIGYPQFSWDEMLVYHFLTRISMCQGKVLGKMQQFGFGNQQETMMNALTEEITQSSEIEGEMLNSEQVRSSLARRLDINLKEFVPESHHIDGIVQSLMDAVQNYKMPLTDERLFSWHAALFPRGYSGIHKIHVAEYRHGEMQVVSTKRYEEIVHYEAPSSELVPAQMRGFMAWLNKDGNENPLIKAAIAHLWFVIIHPFEDGNGRLARTITEMMLARSENTHLRFYSMSSQIQKEKNTYYDTLKQTTCGGLDITPWLVWFFSCLESAILNSDEIAGKVLVKAEFWHKHSVDIPNKTQREIINRLFDGIEGNLSSGKAAKMFKISQDTASRLLKDLEARGFLAVAGGGRSTHYILLPHSHIS
jgi:Fic family protein